MNSIYVVQRSVVLHVKHFVLVLVLIFQGVGAGCDCSAPQPDSEVEPAPSVEVELPLQLIVDADRRIVSDALRASLMDSSVEVRRLGARSLSRLGVPEAIPLLLRAARDPDPMVRSHASVGLAAFETPDSAAALIGMLAAESESTVRGWVLEDLGRVGGAQAIPAFISALSGETEERAGACRGLGAYGGRRVPLDAGIADQVSERAADDESDMVREACAFALSRLTLASGSERLRSNLERSSEDSSAAVRRFSVRALGKMDDPPLEPLLERTADQDWTVAVTAFGSLQSLARREAPRSSLPGQYALALRQVLDRSFARPSDVPHGVPVFHVLLSGLRVPLALAEHQSVRGVAQEARDRALQGEANRDLGLVHCAAARVLDLAAGHPEALNDCGREQVPDWEREVAQINLLGDLLNGEDAPDLASALGRHFNSEDPRVLGAVLPVAARVAEPEAANIILSGLQKNDVGVVAAAAEALANAVEAWVDSEPEEPESYASVRLAGEPAPAAPPVVAAPAFPRPAQIHRALARANTFLEENPDPEASQSWMGAVLAASDEGFRDRLQLLAASHNRAVREKAAEVIAALGWPVPEAEPASIPNPITVEQLRDLPRTAIVETTRGGIEIELFAEETPTTVARFVGLAREGFYEGLSFHRVVPGFVIQGGDPRGDGYGGPGWSQRCEPTRQSYERGTVGMALAGFDTGGSQFFITHASQPHLTGLYTAFGRVTAGMDHVDQIQPGDVIQQVRFPEHGEESVARENAEVAPASEDEVVPN